MRFARLLALVVLWVAVARPAAGLAAAADVTWPVTPDPSECRVAPRPAAEYEAWLLKSPTPEPAVDAKGLYRAGTPADAATVDAVVATEIELAACLSGGQLAQARALMTPGLALGDVVYLIHTGRSAEQLAAVVADATPAPPLPEKFWITVYGVRDVRVLADGRVGALVDIPNPYWPRHPGDTDFNLHLFAPDEGRLLLDDLLLWDEAVPVATPVG